MKKILFAFIFLLFFSSCKESSFLEFKKELSKIEKILKIKIEKKRFFTVAFEKEYSKSLEGKIIKRVITDFLKNSKIRFYRVKKWDKKKIVESLNKKDIDIAIISSNEIENNLSNFKTVPIFSDGFYVIYCNGGKKDFNKLVVATIYDKKLEDFARSRFSTVKDIQLYASLDNFIFAIKESKIDVAVLRRVDYYDRIYEIPTQKFFFQNVGEPYTSILILNPIVKNNFNNYIKSIFNGYDWTEYVFISKKDIRKLENFVRKLQRDFDLFLKGFIEFFTFKE